MAAFCAALEQEKLDKCLNILEQQSDQEQPVLDLSLPNADGFTPLELAFMTGSRALIQLVLAHGGQEGDSIPPDKSPQAVSAHLLSLIHESKKQVDKFGQLMKAANKSSSQPQLSQAQLKECQKQQTLWTKRMNTMKKLRHGFDQAGCPHAPAQVEVSVIGPNAISVRLREEPERLVGGQNLYTKYKVQWSHQDSFATLQGERVVTQEVNELTCTIENLLEGQRVFVRASFGNPKGFGSFSASTPKSMVPSSWRSVEDRVPRIQNQLDICVDLFANLVRSSGTGPEDDPQEPHRAHNKRKGLRHLFSSSSAPKFQRNIHSNRLYLSCVFFHEDKVLMTNEEILPIMEIDDEFPQSIQSEHQWLAKLSYAWRDIERLKHEATKISGPALKFRAKLLQAAMNMQHGLGVSDLGQAFHRPLVHPDGSVIFCLVSHIRQPKSVVSLSLKWVPLSKAQRRSSFDGGQISPMDSLRYSIREQILFQQVCEIRLSRGLFLCYLQAESSIDSMKIVVSNTSPSILPYMKVRDNPHVTCDEWNWLTRLGRIASGQTSSMAAPSPTTNFLAGEGEEGSDIGNLEQTLKMLKPTEAQYSFGKSVQVSLERLFDYLEIPGKDRKTHRLYASEIIELSSEVSVILVLPGSDTICSMADNRPSLNLQRNDLLTLPLQIFESVHLGTYHLDLLSAYCRASLLMDFDLILAKQTHREAFSNQEMEEAQNQLTLLLDQQQVLEDNWKPIRWLLEVLPNARNKNYYCGLRFDHLTEWYANQTDIPDDTQFISKEETELKFKRQDTTTLSQINASHPMKDGSSASATGTLTYHDEEGDVVGGAGKSALNRTPTTRSDPLEFNLSSNKENEVRNFPRMAFATAAQSSQSTPSSSGQFVGVVPQQQQPQTAASSYNSLTYSQHSTNSSLSSTTTADPHQTGGAAYHSRHDLHSQHQQPQPYYENQPGLAAASSSSRQYQRKQSTSLERPAFKQSYDPRVAQSGRFSNMPRGQQQGLESGVSPQLNATRSLSPEPNILQVFAAYDTGLASGTSVKLNVTHTTSAREVIDLVIKQLNMAVILKGKDGPIYENDRLKNFCLVAVIGNRERCLRDDFKPLNLQNPWKKGKLFVRMKNDLLAAIEHISRHSTML